MNQGEKQRTMILALENVYHGDTFKTMEAGDIEVKDETTLKGY